MRVKRGEEGKRRRENTSRDETVKETHKKFENLKKKSLRGKECETHSPGDMMRLQGWVSMGTDHSAPPLKCCRSHSLASEHWGATEGCWAGGWSDQIPFEKRALTAVCKWIAGGGPGLGGWSIPMRCDNGQLGHERGWTAQSTDKRTSQPVVDVFTDTFTDRCWGWGGSSGRNILSNLLSHVGMEFNSLTSSLSSHLWLSFYQPFRSPPQP